MLSGKRVMEVVGKSELSRIRMRWFKSGNAARFCIREEIVEDFEDSRL
jgi:hypothetical protein